MMRRVAAPLGFALLLCAPGDGSAQSAESLAAQCAAGLAGEPTMCARAAGAGRDLAGYIGLLAGPGSELSGQASTLGRRLGGAPRIGASLRGGGSTVTLPSLASVGEGESSPFVTSVQATLAFGLFDGFQVLSTVGGLLSFDVIASGSVLHFSSSDGFDGNTTGYSIGARVGLLRESFTLPAVTISASRRFVGGLQFGDIFDSGDQAEVTLDPGITSVRATVGKDLFAFGVLAGLAWDDFSSETTVRMSPGGSLSTHTATLEDSRWSAFGGLSKQIGVIAWISGEIGWVSGFDPVSAGAGASPDVGRTFYGSVAFVLKL